MNNDGQQDWVPFGSDNTHPSMYSLHKQRS